jgi:hypothetical protein
MKYLYLHIQVFHAILIVAILSGLVAQWTRARGYEPRCQGFESLLARIFKIKNYPDSLVISNRPEYNTTYINYFMNRILKM